MPDRDDWRDLSTEAPPPDGVRVEVKGFQNMGGDRWEPYLSFAVLSSSGWFGEHGGDHLNLVGRYKLTHWRFVPSITSDLDWDLDRQDAARDFDAGSLRLAHYDLHQARELIRQVPRPIETLDLTRRGPALRSYLETVTLRPRHQWGDLDLSFPVLFGRDPENRMFPLDGRHRIALALEQGRDSLPVVFLSQEETAAIMSWIGMNGDHSS